MRERAEKRSDGYHEEDVCDHGEQRARKILQVGQAHFQTTRSELRGGRKNDWMKCLLAELVQAETTMRLDWISEELGMGSRSWCCHQTGQTRLKYGSSRSRGQLLKKAIKTAAPP